LIDAAAELGVTDVRFLGYDGSVPMVEREIIEDIADVIGDVLPDIIITHNPNDSVPGHAVATQMTLLAMEAASGIRPGKHYPPHKSNQIFFHAHPGRTNVHENDLLRIPTTIVDMTDAVQQKASAMNKFTSQHYGDDSPLQRKLSEVLDGLYGISARVPYAEAFIAYNPQTCKTLPVDYYDTGAAGSSMEEVYAHMTQMMLDSYQPRG
jgi:LmbE family N-acetylglucosaminyl deacetylase